MTPLLAAEDVPGAAFKFVALLLRLQDLVLLTPERAASTFREDATKAIRESLGRKADIKENEPIAPGIEFPADLIIRSGDRDPVAVFLAMSEQRVLEAVVAQMAVTYEAHASCSVIALLEKDSSVTRKMRTRASNRLTAMPIFEGDQKAAIQRIEREVLGRKAMLN
jgi:flagellar biosynthesis GTPase FlhF